MIGWSVEHRQARIALDVGEDAVHFENPDLPDTRSEMALPLISRDEVIGALTVQSIERGALSQEDVTLCKQWPISWLTLSPIPRLYEQAQSRAQELVRPQ